MHGAVSATGMWVRKVCLLVDSGHCDGGFGGIWWQSGLPFGLRLSATVQTPRLKPKRPAPKPSECYDPLGWDGRPQNRHLLISSVNQSYCRSDRFRRLATLDLLFRSMSVTTTALNSSRSLPYLAFNLLNTVSTLQLRALASSTMRIRSESSVNSPNGSLNCGSSQSIQTLSRCRSFHLCRRGSFCLLACNRTLDLLRFIRSAINDKLSVSFQISASRSFSASDHRPRLSMFICCIYHFFAPV